MAERKKKPNPLDLPLFMIPPGTDIGSLPAGADPSTESDPLRALFMSFSDPPPASAASGAQPEARAAPPTAKPYDYGGYLPGRAARGAIPFGTYMAAKIASLRNGSDVNEELKKYQEADDAYTNDHWWTARGTDLGSLMAGGVAAASTKLGSKLLSRAVETPVKAGATGAGLGASTTYLEKPDATPFDIAAGGAMGAAMWPAIHYGGRFADDFLNRHAVAKMNERAGYHDWVPGRIFAERGAMAGAAAGAPVGAAGTYLMQPDATSDDYIKNSLLTSLGLGGLGAGVALGARALAPAVATARPASQPKPRSENAMPGSGPATPSSTGHALPPGGPDTGLSQTGLSPTPATGLGPLEPGLRRSDPATTPFSRTDAPYPPRATVDDVPASTSMPPASSSRPRTGPAYDPSTPSAELFREVSAAALERGMSPAALSWSHVRDSILKAVKQTGPYGTPLFGEMPRANVPYATTLAKKAKELDQLIAASKLTPAEAVKRLLAETRTGGFEKFVVPGAAGLGAAGLGSDAGGY